MKFEGFSTENRRFVQTVTTTIETLPEDILEDHSARLLSRGGHFTREQMLPVYFAALIGHSGNDAEYNNLLFSLRDSLIRSPKLLLYVENALKPPFANEIERITRPDFSLNIEGDELRSGLANEILCTGENAKIPPTEENIRLISWLYRCVSHPDYQKSLPQIPCLLYYGAIGESELEFLFFMSKIGIDVLYISSDNGVLPLLKKNNAGGRMQILELIHSKPCGAYPDRLLKAKLATHAYKAESEVKTLFYDNNAFFKDFQYKKNHARTLKTTYEEIDILWHQQARFRTGFEVINGDTAVIPNLFVKISGVKDGNMTAYWNNVRQKLSPMTKISRKSPTYAKTDFTRLFDVYKFYYDKDGKLLIPQLKASKHNNYGFLSEELQDLVFEKMQEAADSGFIKLERNDLMVHVIYVGLNLDREILTILQKFDYTKDIPKIIIIDVIEETFSKIECVQLLLYNLLGFDVAVFTPTGYRNIETYLDGAAYETYTMNEFKHKVAVPGFKLPSVVPDLTGRARKLFRKK